MTFDKAGVPSQYSLSPVVCLVVAAMMAGCGGGGGGDSSAKASGNTVETASATPDESASSGVVVDPEFAMLMSSAAPVAVNAGYFVDAQQGSDANAGTLESPWKTLAKAASARLKSGQGIYLRCGRVWRESLTLTWTQLVDGNIIAGYGDECATKKATITGADDFSGNWVKVGNVWQRQLPLNTPKIARLFIDGSSLRPAQWPNFRGVGSEFAISADTSPVSTTQLESSVADRAALAGKDLVGATLLVRSDAHYIDRKTVTSFDPASGMFNMAAVETQSQMEGGNGYLLQDKLWMLDAPGEFFHDTQTGMLYVYPKTSATQANLNTALVEGSVRDIALSVVNRSNLTVKHLALVKARADGLFVNEAAGAVVFNVEGSDNGRSGVRFKLGAMPAGVTRGGTLRNSTLLNNWVYGVDSLYAVNVDVTASHVKDTGTIDFAGMTDAAIGAGAGGVITGNDIQRSAFLAVRFRGTGGTTIVNNDMGSYCLRLSDCAAIYTWNGPKGSQKTVNQSSLIADNRITEAAPNLEGATGGAMDIVAGIYLDDFSQGSTVRNNMIKGTPMGIYIHNGSNHTIQNNKVWLTTKTALWANMSESDADYMTGNVISGNELVPISSVTGVYPALPKFNTSHAVWFKNNVSGFNGLAAGGTQFVNNHLVQLNGASVEAAWVRSASEFMYLTANGWRGLNPGEAAATNPATFQLYKTTLGPELVNDGGFENGFTAWSSTVTSQLQGGSLRAVSGVTGCSGLCALFNASSTSDTLSSQGFNMTAGTPYVMSFTGSYGSTARVRPWIARNGTPWDSLLDGSMSALTPLTGNNGDVIQYEGFFKSTTTSSVKLMLQMATMNVPVGLDGVSVRQLTGYSLSNKSDWVVAVAAPRDVAKTINYSDTGWPSGTPIMDADGATVTLPLQIAAGQSKLLLRADSAWRK